MPHAKAGDLFLGFASVPLPDAIEAFRVRMRERTNPSGYERYASRLLGEIDLARLRRVADAHEIVVARIVRMDAFYLNYSQMGMKREDILFLQQVETVLNRLLRVGNVVDATTIEPSEETCSVLDQRAFRRVIAAANDMLGHAGGMNPWARPGTVRCKPGGEWDIRTRLGRLCESFSPIVHLDYSYSCDAERGLVTITFTAPDRSAMPLSVCDEETAAWTELDDVAREGWVRELAYRIAFVLAAAGFASGLHIRHCSVRALDPQAPHQAGPWFTVSFERAHFMVHAPSMAEGYAMVQLSDPVCGRALAELRTDEPVFEEGAADPRWHQLTDDDRPLPAQLRSRLLADTARELDVMETENSSSMQRFNELRPSLALDPASAIGSLTDLVGELEADCAAAELQSDVPLVSQFCENHIGRLLVPLLADGDDLRIHRAPDALYFAQYELVEAYVHLGRPDEAIREARRLLDMASTSIQAHFMLINVLARAEKYQDVIDVCRHGLRVAYDRGSAAYYFYRMAFAYWALGNRPLALACYGLVPAGEQISQVAQMETKALMGEMGRSKPLPFEAAVAAVRAAGICIAPGDEVSNLVADSAVLLIDNGFYALGQACASYMWRIMGSDELGAVARSLQPPDRQ